MWSCQWRVLREDPEIGAFLALLNLSEPLKPKDCFKGGRTNAYRLYYEVQDGEKIYHIDICSLYPYINKYGEYPIGHPEIIVSNFDDIRNYFGFVKCIVSCPDRDDFPVLPVTINKKLVFPLCWSCARDKQKTHCEHQWNARYLEGTWTTAELHYALDHGYQVIEVQEVWHWKERKKG